MAKRKNKEIDPNVCWKCGSKNLMVSNNGKLVHCKSCGHGVEMKETFLITLTSKEFVDEIKPDMLKISYSEIKPGSQVYCELLDEITNKILKGEKEWEIKEYLKCLIK